MSRFIIMMPYYESPEMLWEHIRYWLQYPIWLTTKVGVILVDDGSPTKPAEEVLRTATLPYFPIELYRIKENIPWNHGGAKNLGMHVVQGQDTWVLNTDMDLVMDAGNMERLLSKKLSPRNIYRPGRLRRLEDGGLEVMKTHKETFIMTREMFWKIGGYDEDLAGYWNGVFMGFMRNMTRYGKLFELKDVFLLNYSGFKDASVTEWGRGHTQWDAKPKLNHHSRWLYRPKNPLRFTWERVFTSGCEVDGKG